MQCVDVERQVLEALADYFPEGRRVIQANSRLVEDLSVDSMVLIEIVMTINEVFGVELPASGVAEWRTVADICSLVVKILPTAPVVYSL